MFCRSRARSKRAVWRGKEEEEKEEEKCGRNSHGGGTDGGRLGGETEFDLKGQVTQKEEAQGEKQT